MKMTRLCLVAMSLFVFVFWTSSAQADAFDVTWLLTRVTGWRRSPIQVLVLVALLLSVNYVINVLVIAVPAASATVALRRAVRDMVGYTFIAQLADRIGMVACGMVVVMVRLLTNLGTTMQDLGSISMWTVGANFITSGICVWLLARYYLVNRWQVPKRRGALIATAASVLTNPAWAIAAVPLLGRGR